MIAAGGLNVITPPNKQFNEFQRFAELQNRINYYFIMSYR